MAKRETVILLALVAFLALALCGVSGALIAVLYLRENPALAPPKVEAVSSTSPSSAGTASTTSSAPVGPVAVTPGKGPSLLKRLAGAPAAAASDEWTTREDALGFKVELPRDWTVEPDKASGRVLLSGPTAERIHLWPVFVPGGLDDESARRLLVGLASKLAPGADWKESDLPARSVARAR